MNIFVDFSLDENPSTMSVALMSPPAEVATATGIDNLMPLQIEATQLLGTRPGPIEVSLSALVEEIDLDHIPVTHHVAAGTVTIKLGAPKRIWVAGTHPR